jgi:hypothetical protein
VTGYLFAPGEEHRVAADPGCAAEIGDQIRRGRYKVFLQQSDDVSPKPEEIVLFGGQALECNESRLAQGIRVLAFDRGSVPDLLILRQYAGCNGTLVTVLGLSPAGNHLVKYQFVTPVGERDTQFVETIEVGTGQTEIKTTTYDNSKGRRTQTLWRVRPETGKLEPVTP